MSQTFTSPDSAANDNFGISVALSFNGNTALIGAAGKTVGAHTDAGAAYVFSFTGSTWNLQQEITATDAAAGDSLGSKVALSSNGNTALVGAYGKTVGAHADAGAAYVLTFTGSTWTQQEFTAADGAAFDHFGAAVALTGDGTAGLVGAFGKTVHGNAGAGAVYAYTLSGGNWTEVKESTDPGGAANDGFGISVALGGAPTTALVGAYGKTVGGNTGAGAAYIDSQSGAAAPATGTPTATAPVTGPTVATGTPTATATASPSAPSKPTAAYFAEGYTGTAAGNGRATFSETLNLLNPGTTPAPVTITYYIQGSQAPRIVTRTVSPTSVLRESVNSDVGPDQVVAAQVTSPQRVYVTRTMTRTAPDGSRLDGSATLPVSAPATRWGFPEGYTGSTFQEYLTILNPNSSPAHVSILLAPQADTAAGAKTLTLTVPALSRSTANIRSLNATGSAKSVGMLISSD